MAQLNGWIEAQRELFAGRLTEFAHSRTVLTARVRLNAARVVIAGRLAHASFSLKETFAQWSRRRPMNAARARVPEAERSNLARRSAQSSTRPEPNWNPTREWRAVARKNFFVVGAFSALVNLLMLTIPLYLFQLSDRVLTSHSLDTLFMLSGLAFVFIAVLVLMDIFRRQLLGALANRMATILGGPLLAGVINSSKLGDGANVQAIRSLNHVRSFISSPLMLLLFDAPMAPIYFAAVFLINPELGIIALLSGLVLIAIALLNQKTTSEPLARASAHAMRADAHADALARNSQVINAMGMLNESILLWGREQAHALTWQLSALDRNFWISGASKFFRLITQISVLGWGAYLALNGRLTGGMMVAASIIASRALQPLEGMIEGWRSVVQTRAAYGRIIAAVERLQREEARLRLPRPQGRINADRLLYIAPGTKEPVLNGLTFDLAAGESLAIVGPSGSGKSTLARILVGCVLPTAGNIRLDGTEIRNWDRRQFGESIGYLPQEVELFPGTIKENVCRMRDDLPDEKIYDAAVAAGVHDMICHLPNGYETVLEGGGAPLSGGQKQRIALARALFGAPSMIVLDEPNSNLDAAGEQALAETLQRAKEKRVTVVVVTQRPAVLNNVDKVLVLRTGRMEALGPPDQVLHRLVRGGDAGRQKAPQANGATSAGEAR
jgi:ATP-binding cassette, subfamily C, type I secretion system permease/ATPase